MSFPQAIQTALLKYDERKRSELLDDHPAIVALRNFSEADQSSSFRIYQCFVTGLSEADINNFFDISQQFIGDSASKDFDELSAVEEVYLSVLEHLGPDIASALTIFDYSGLLTQANFHAVAAHADCYEVVELLYSLSSANLLTQANFDIVIVHPRLEELSDALGALDRAGRLTQADFDAVSAQGAGLQFGKAGP